MADELGRLFVCATSADPNAPVWQVGTGRRKRRRRCSSTDRAQSTGADRRCLAGRPAHHLHTQPRRSSTGTNGIE